MRSLFALLLIGLLMPLYSAVSIQQSIDSPWQVDENTTYNDSGVLKTGTISDDKSTSVTLTFSDVSSVAFFIRTSTEGGGCDRLIVEFGDGNTYEYSGEMDYWEQLQHDWGWEGEHTVTLTYLKDGSVSSGEDCCWIWFEGVNTLNLGDDSSKDWDMSKEHAWECYPWMTYQNSAGKEVPFMKTPYIEDSQESWISYTVEGVEYFSFQYIVSSEEGSDFLVVSVDGMEIESFSGDRWWETYEIQLPDTERHVIKWTYRKDENGNSSGNDEAYVWFEGIENIMIDGYSMNLVYPWVKDSEVTYIGETLRSGEISDNETTSFSVIVPNGREDFCYTWKVSSEEGCDLLRVYKNDELMNSISGEVDWESCWFWANSGDVIRFEYAKDDNGKSAGQDCGWVWIEGIDKFMSVMHLFPDDDTITVEVALTIKFDLNTGRDVQRGILDGDDGVSFASGEYPAWIHDETEGAMRSAEIARGGESWMSATVVGKGTFSFRWKCSGETLSCYVDGELKETLYGAADWANVDVALENDARHEIKWVFARGEDSTDVAACGWVDGIVWDAPEGWDDPDEPIVPATVSTFIPLDLRPSPRVFDTTNFCERITYDPAWRNAASVVLSVNASEAVKTTESGAYEWKSEKEGLFEMKLEFLDSVGAAIGEPLTASFKIVLDPLPALGENATAEDVASILGGVVDGKLKANVVEAAEYANFRAWLEAKGINHNDVTKSLFAWLSYALDTARLIAAEPKDGDVKIETFESSSTGGAFEFTVKLKDIAVGDGAIEANLKKVFDIQGRETLSAGEFSSATVQIDAAQADNGNVKFTVSPKIENSNKPNSFFFKVKMK